jgi:hypothetical protein
MPKEIEKQLAKQARKKNFGKKRTDRYVYGTMQKMGMLKPKKKTII